MAQRGLGRSGWFLIAGLALGLGGCQRRPLGCPAGGACGPVSGGQDAALPPLVGGRPDAGSSGDADGVAPTPDAGPPAAACGDGRLDPGEACDDGNTSDADDCSSACLEQKVLAAGVGGGRTCVILTGGRVKCWGYVAGGFLGLGDSATRGDAPGQMGASLPALDLGSNQAAVAVSLGFMHTCALLAGGRVKCWGGNPVGELGLGDHNDRGDQPGQMGDALPFVDLGTGEIATAISAGLEHTCALLAGGRVKCWGSNDRGALGLGDTANRGTGPGQMGDALPVVDLGTGRTAIAISTGTGSSTYYDHTCALLDDGRVKCWGSNSGGQLGLGDTMNRGDKPGQMGDNLPAVDFGADQTAVSVSAGYAFNCALLRGGSVKCWGGGGMIGLGDTTTHGDRPGTMGDNLPAVDLGAGRKAVAIACGYATSCALLDDGALKCWGMNYDGQLGLGDTRGRGDMPGQMGDDLPAIDLGTGRRASAVIVGTAGSGGTDHACALLDDWSIKCWGAGSELGLGDRLPRGDKPGEMGDALPTVKLFSDAW